jgi:hypothetical protein
MRRIDIDDMDAVMSFKGKGNSRRYAFDDFSDRIRLENKIAKILRDRKKRSDNQLNKGKTMGKPMAGANALMELKASMRKPQLEMVYKDQKNVRCDTTHIFTSEHTEVIDGLESLEELVFNGIITLSQAKRQCPGIQSIHWSRSSDGMIGNRYSVVGNVH